MRLIVLPVEPGAISWSCLLNLTQLDPRVPNESDRSMTPSEILRLRLQLGWSQARAAQMLNVRRPTLEKWERGQRRPQRASIRRLEVMSLWLVPRKRIRRVPVGFRSPAIVARHAKIREQILARLDGRSVVASISGGKDSAAMSLFLHELGIEHRRVFLDTGWESPITYEYLKTVLPQSIGPITWLRSPRQMEDLIRHKGMFPGRRIRFCTQELKIFPMQRFLRTLIDQGHEVINAVGIRAAESLERSKMPSWEWQEGFDCEVWRPLLEWTEKDVVAIHRRHGLNPNPLYL